MVSESQRKFGLAAGNRLFSATKMRPSAPYNVLPPFLAALIMLAMAGCGRDGVKVYKVDPNDTAAAPPPSAMQAGLAAPDNSGLPQLKYALPEGWKEKPASQMRVASFEVSENGKTADVSVIPLGGIAGGDPANVNRWRGQVGLTPLADDEMLKLAEKIEVAGQPSDLYEIAGANPASGDAQRIIATILHRDVTAWFFKMSGESALVEKNKAAFIAFLRSIQFEASGAAATDVGQLPPSHPAIPGMTAAVPTAATDPASKPAWTVPAGWKDGPLAQFLVAKFIIQGSGDATAAVNVSQLSGDGGGQLANLNRWRAQLGLEPLTNEIPPVTIGPPGMTKTVAGTLTVDYVGTDVKAGKPSRLVGSIVPQNGQTWFYKMMGDPDLVAAQKEAFAHFVESAKYPAGQ